MATDGEIALRRLDPPKRTVTEEKKTNIIEMKFVGDHLNTPVSIYLSSGVKLDCHIISYDEISLVTTQKDSTRKSQLIYKSHIMTICEK